MHCHRSNQSGRPLVLQVLDAGLRVTRVFLISATILLLGTLDHPRTLSAQNPPKREPISVDILLRGGTVIDGTGSGSQTCDVAITKGKLILPKAGTQIDAVWEIDCTGLIVCPGFIDLHNHSDGEIEDAETRAAMNYVMQGCSTLVTGNCGFGPIKVAAYYDHIDEYGAGTNIAHLLPQGGLRKAVLDSSRVAPTEPQIQV